MVAAAAALVTWWFEPIGGTRGIRPITAFLAIIGISWGTVAHAHGVPGSFSVDALLSLPSRVGASWLGAYITFGATLWAWWRGSMVPDADHADVMRVLKRGAIAVMVFLAVLTPTGISSGTGMVVEVIAFLLLGLAALSLARIVAEEVEGMRAAQWRWLRSTIATTLLVFLAGILLLALLAEPARVLLREGLLWIVYAALVVLAPVFWLVYSALDALVSGILALGSDALGTQATAPPAYPAQNGPTPQTPLDDASAFLAVPAIILALVPLLILVVLIVYARRRRERTVADMGEEHESLFTWDAVKNDLRAMLAALRVPRPGVDGLQAALQRLQGSDPAVRVRRRYVELLLLAESTGHARRPPQTPHEFEPELASAELDKAAVDTLTTAYEQARYAPQMVDEGVVARADSAWQALDKTDSRAVARRTQR